MFEQVFTNLTNLLFIEAGCSTQLDYTEQISWMLFLKYLDDLESRRRDQSELEGKRYKPILSEEFRWSSWASPRKEDGTYDDNNALTGDDLIEFVDGKLFPYLRGFRKQAESSDTIEYKIGEIFGEIKNRFQSGYSMREALGYIDRLKFGTQKEKHEMSELYESRINKMGNAGQNGGQYYTPRPLIRAMIKVINPRIGETIYDGACGSAGFLCEAHDYLQKKTGMSVSEFQTLQKNTFYGKEIKSLAYIIGIMNMILHGIDAPNIVHTNTLAENTRDFQEKDRYDVILANPPFGSGINKEVQANFIIKSSEPAYLFLQHFMKSLRAGGRAAVVIKNTFLSNSDNASKALRKELLETCNLYAVLDCPQKTFLGAGVKTVVLFFKKGEATRNIWYYQLDPGRSLGKTNPLNDYDLKEFVKLQRKADESEKSWSVDVNNIDPESWDLSVKNPNEPEAAPIREPQIILDEIEELDRKAANVLEGIRGML